MYYNHKHLLKNKSNRKPRNRKGGITSMNALNINKKGFTIIEVVLVLAIAGLIFLMVFIALPALQRSQRDTQRKNDAGRFLSQINSYQSNNRGKVPTADAAGVTGANGLIPKYLQQDGDLFEDPQKGVTYTFSYNPATVPSTIGSMDYTVNSRCGAAGAVTTGAGGRKVSVRVPLEGGGVYCTNN